MRCPRCDRLEYDPTEPCPGCRFSGDPETIGEWERVRWVLGEIEDWSPSDVPDAVRQHLLARYTARRDELEVALGLRPPPLTEEQARQAWAELIRYEALTRGVGKWLEAGLLDTDRTQAVVDDVTGRVDRLRERLEGHPRPGDAPTDAERLDAVDLLLERVDDLSWGGAFAGPHAVGRIRSALLDEKRDLEIALGLRAVPVPEAEPVGALVDAEPEGEGTHDVPPPDVRAAPPPPVPAVPFRERLWRTLVSERTLRAILFLGILLLFSAALSFVIWGWRDFSAGLRILIPVGFTALFYVLGWYVRVRMALYRSGIALSAIASLLIPIDCYTALVSLDVPPDYWPEFWLTTSLLCLVAYIVVTLIIQSPLFGYLIGATAGSAVLAAVEIGHKAVGLSQDWSSAALSVLAVGMVTLAAAIARHSRPGRWRVLVDPLRYLALLAVGVLMPLTFGWRFVGRPTVDTLHYALTINWWLGGALLSWGAVTYRSRGLGLLAAFSVPAALYLTQAAAFERAGINPAWHALGWAGLVPLYLAGGRRLLSRVDDPVFVSHGRTVTGWGIVLLVVAALWSFTDLTSGAASACSHAVLSGALVLAAALWQRPRILYAASLLGLSAATFATAELGLTPAQLGVGWASLSIVHLLAALSLGGRSPGAARFSAPLVVAGYVVAALALLPALVMYDGSLVAYTLGNWIGLAAWGARLAHAGRPGFAASRSEDGTPRPPILYHWLAALPLPFWLWVLFANRRPPDPSLALALSALSWGMVALSHRLARTNGAYRLPWRLTGLLTGAAGTALAFLVAPGGFSPALCLLAAGTLFFVDALVGRTSLELLPAGLVTAWGCVLLLERLPLSLDATTFVLSALVALYFLVGLRGERRRSALLTGAYLGPLYLAAHLLTLLVLGRVYGRALGLLLEDGSWTDQMRLWSAAAQLVLGVVYGLYAWGTYRERWGHVAAWLGTAGGGILFTIYSRGRGSSAAKAALMAILFVLAERALHWLWHHPRVQRRRRAFARAAWHLYRRPLLVAGWSVSAGVVGLALIRNLLLLGGGKVQQTWAATGLLLIVGLYAFSARLFRRARFVWLATVLLLAPWTILSNLGWFTALRPTVPGFGISWAALSCALFLSALLVERLASRAYALPLRVTAHLLLPFSLLWGIADVDTGRVTFGLAVALYGLASFLDGRRYRRAGGTGSVWAAIKFRFPALALIPVWSVYLLAWLLPGARHEHFGLMLLASAPLGLIAGRWLLTFGAAGRLPAYLVAYASLIVGTLLVAHLAPLLALALLFDAALMLVSARLFRNPLWAYPAAAMVPLSLLISLHEAGVAGNRHGWWLIGLAALYLAMAWLLRRMGANAYGTSVLAVGFALIALGLPPSSRDQIGALWGYGSAALLYAIAAFWLGQPLLLTPACALAVVPYAVSLHRSALLPEVYGLALLPGSLAALGMGWALDARLGAWHGFPWARPERWPAALAERLLRWWGLPLYALGFGLAVVNPLFLGSRSDLRALDLALLVPLFAWAIYRFRLRGWLLAMGTAAHLAVWFYLDVLGWWAYPADAWLRFMPVTAITTVAALIVERRREEGSPMDWKRLLYGWSRPLYLLALVDVSVAQATSTGGTRAGAWVTLAHGLLLGLLASAWRSSILSYLGTAWGALALGQWLLALEWPRDGFSVAFARLSLGYGLFGYGLALWRRGSTGVQAPPDDAELGAWSFASRRAWRGALRTLILGLRGAWTRALGLVRLPGGELPPWLGVWERPLQRAGLVLSWGVLALATWLSLDLVSWTVRAMLGQSFREIVDLATVRMAVSVLSWIGLLYVAASAAHRRLGLGYLAVGMLLAGWMLHAFYVQEWDGLARVQWYAAPAGLYLLGVAYLEWRIGHRAWARWLDYAAMLLMFGSLFWQTMLFGWQYALMLGTEGLALFWWGSARRLRRFFYAGMVGVVLATVGQLINSLQKINQWIVFGVIGILLVVVAAIVERRLEAIRASLQQVLEDWE